MSLFCFQWIVTLYDVKESRYIVQSIVRHTYKIDLVRIKHLDMMLMLMLIRRLKMQSHSSAISIIALERRSIPTLVGSFVVHEFRYWSNHLLLAPINIRNKRCANIVTLRSIQGDKLCDNVKMKGAHRFWTKYIGDMILIPKWSYTIMMMTMVFSPPLELN